MPRYAGGPVAGDLPDDSIEGLTDEVDRIVEDATKAGKIPPARQAKVFEDLIVACGGTFDRTSVDRFRQQVESMPVLVNTEPSRPPSPQGDIHKILAHEPQERHDARSPGPFAADWQLWAHIPESQVWEAVLLSLDIEPSGFSPRAENIGDIDATFILPRGAMYLPIEDAVGLMPDIDVEEIHRRLKIAVSHLGKTLKSRDSFLGPYSAWTKINLAEFRTFAGRIWPDKRLPEKFPRPDAVATEAPKPLENRERGSLLTIVAAFAKKNKIDIDQRRKAGDAIEAIVKEQLGKKISSRAIQNYLKNAEDLIARRTDDPEADDG